ncbi:MAG: hypothetical protein M3131_03615 [Actinomycetota bacterium]|nr:hypothetical protein [Actinomycetota bacterium]
MHTPSRGPYERLQAWLVTGPLGHLWSVVADLALFAARQLGRRARLLLSLDRPGLARKRRQDR